jgi:nitroreductase
MKSVTEEKDLQVLERFLKERRSIRKWEKGDVPDDFLKKAVELATWAPNGGNYQGWRFIIVKNRQVMERMADAVQSVIDKIASWPEAKTWPEDIARYQKNGSFFRNAGAYVAVFVSQYQSPMDKVLKARESFDPEARQIIDFRKSAPTSVQSAAAAVTNMLLVLHQMGLGAIWLAAPLLAKGELEAILKVDRSLSLVCLVAVGHPGETPHRDRKPVDQVLEFVR